MTDLSGPGVRVLLMATATHQGPTLTSLPSVATTFTDLNDALIERCGVPATQVRAILDPPDAQTMARAVAEEAQDADTVLMVYFIGHGLLGPDNELYLAAANTDRLVAGLAEYQALSFSSLRQALTVSRASSIVVVLDCCFSGRVSLGARASVAAFTMAPVHGVYLIGSAEQLALAPPDAAHTSFTGALLDLLAEGDPRGPHALTLDAVYDGVFRIMRDRQHPLPRRQAGDRSGTLVIAANPAAPEPNPVDELEPDQGRCPYPGLDAFGIDDADAFFGREPMTARLLTAAAAEIVAPDRGVEPGPLVLVGASGSGKTSLLNAGFLAQLAETGLSGVPGSARWLRLRFTPGPNPLQRLAVQLHATSSDTVDRLRENPASAVQLVEQLLTDHPDDRVVLVVDQLEELFTLCDDHTERSQFLRAITAIASSPGHAAPRGLVILALRADFYGAAAAHPELLAALRDRQVLVEPMSAEEIRASIEGPAAMAGLALAEGLSDLILNEIGVTVDDRSAVGALPLLSHALWATWRQRAGSRLTFAGYRAAGGISEAIATTAEQVYAELDTAGKDAAQRMMVRLVRVGEDSADTARAVERSTLIHGLPDTGAAQQVIALFTEARLLTLDRDTARISHEALLRAWPRLREWIDADRDWLRLRQQLADDAAAWTRAERDPSLLYRGTRLAALRERAAASPAGAADVEPLLSEFMDNSWRQERRSVRVRRAAIAFLTVLALLASAGLVGSLVFQRQATQARDRDFARYLAAEAEDLRDREPGIAKQLSLLAYQTDHNAGRGALLNSRTAPGVINDGGPAYDLASNADGHVLAVSTGDGITLRTPGAVTAARLSGLVTGPITINRAGTLLAAATYDHPDTTATTVRLWNIANPSHPKQVAAPSVDAYVRSLAVSADGTTLFAGTDSGQILPWNIIDPAAPIPAAPLQAHSTQVDSLAASLQGNLLASLSIDGKLQLWNIADHSQPIPLRTITSAAYATTALSYPQFPLHRVAFDPTGRLLAIPNPDGVSTKLDPSSSLSLWNLDNPESPRRITGNNNTGPDIGCSAERVVSLAFSPKKLGIVAGCDDSWKVWVYKDPKILPGAYAIAPTYAVSGAVVFDPTDDSRLLQTTDQGIYVWDVANRGRPGAQAILFPTALGALSYRSAGQRQLLAVQTRGGDMLWDLTDLKRETVLTAFSAPSITDGADIAISPDGSMFAMLETIDDKTANLRLHSTSAPYGLLATMDVDDGVMKLAFSPTAPILAVSDMNGSVDGNPVAPSVRIYNIADPRHPRQIARIPARAVQLVFSPDGQTLTAVDDQSNTRPGQVPLLRNQLRTWDISNPAHPTELWTPPVSLETRFAGIAYRPDGAWFAAYLNGTLRLWRVEHHRLIGDPVNVVVSDGGAGELVFSPDGNRLALIVSARSGNSGLSRPEIWDLSNPRAPVRQSYLPGNGLDGSLAFSPDGKLLATADDTIGTELWTVDPGSDVADLCRTTGDPMTTQQWDLYVPGHPYRPPCRQ